MDAPSSELVATRASAPLGALRVDEEAKEEAEFVPVEGLNALEGGV